MKVEVKKDEGCQVTLAIELPADRADEIYRELLADFRHNVRLPGFRRGKVPGEMIRKRFAAELRQEVISKLVPEALEEAIREEKLQPVERPTLDEVEYEEGKPLRLTASFQVQPEIELEKYTGLKVELKDSEYEIADEEIESQLEHLRQRSANYEPIEGRPAAEGDYAFIDLRGEPSAEDAAPFRREGILVAVGKEGVPGKLIGAEPRQHLEFAIEHPEDYDDPALAGMTVEYTIDVHELKQRVLPELDDEFAKDLGQFANLDELRAEIRRQLEAEAGRKRRADSMAALLNAIAEANKPFDLPGVMVQRQIAAREDEMRRRIIGSGLNPDHIGYDWKAFRDGQLTAAEVAVRNILLIGTVGRLQNISVKPKQVQAEIEAIARANGEDPKELRRAMLEDGRYESLKGHIFDYEVEQWLLEQNEITGS